MQDSKGRWAKLGRKVREARQRAGLSQGELAKLVMISPTMLSAIERGTRGIKRDHLERIDTALNTPGSLTELWDRSSSSGLPTWYQKVADIEQAASEILIYQPLLIPGLLQSADYAEHIFRVGRPRETPAEIEELVRGRITRQATLRRERPPRLVAVVDEGVLRRPTGGRAIMEEQLTRLLEACDLPNVSIQVVPYESEHHPGLSNAFTLFTVPRRSPILYVETRRSGAPTDDPEAVEDYSQLFAELRGAALPLGASQQLIAKAQGEFS